MKKNKKEQEIEEDRKEQETESDKINKNIKTSNFKQSVFLCLFCLILTITAVAIQIFAVTSKAIDNNAKANNLIVVCENAMYDYEINNPSKEQIKSFSDSEFSKKVVPFYNTMYSVDLDGEEVALSIKSIDDLKDINNTEFPDARLIEKKDCEKGIYIDYLLSKKYNLKIGDKIGSGKMEFTISRIYKNYRSELAFVPNLKAVINALAYNGVYVETSDKSKFKKEFIDDYKPLATLKSREEFSNDEAYNNYIKEFYEKEYSSYISDKLEGYEETKESYNNLMKLASKGYLQGGLVSGLIIVVGLILYIILNLKKIKTEVVNGGRSNVIKRNTLSAIVGAISVLIAWFVCVMIKLNSLIDFVSIAGILSAGWIGLLMPIVGVIVATIVNIFVSSGYKERKE